MACKHSLFQFATLLFVAGFAAAEWSYEGDTGPDHWADTYPECGGTSQSPIDIQTGSVVPNKHLCLAFNNYDTTKGTVWTLTNTGEGAKVAISGDLEYTFQSDGMTYKLDQFHFHWGEETEGSEHDVDGTKLAAEVHLVHHNTKYADLSEALLHKDGLAVLGFLFKVSEEDNPYVDIIQENIDDIIHAGSSTPVDPFPLTDFLLPDLTKQKFWRYSGSLTTPPCTEVVTWTVFQEYLTISKEQLEAFRTLLTSHETPTALNWRPTQPLNGRTVYEKPY